jgi:glycosyltransferase involved in cell wall biosynthesis
MICTIFCYLRFLQNFSMHYIFTKKTTAPVKKITVNLYIRYAYKVFDGIVVISHYLLNYFKNKISKNAKLLLIPIIVDHTQFSINNRQNKKGKVKKIVYAGSLCQDKDGIIDLITAFKILCDKRSDVRLILIGNIDKSKNKTDMLNLVDNFGLADKVKITGFIPRNDLVKNLIEADVLALYKPKTLQNEYCFPTKIGEYLSTGNPVVTTDIGEISYYLKDNYNAFLARAGNIESFAFKLCEALDKKSSKMIGEQGKKTAEEEFNYIKAGEKLIAFFHQLLKYKK